jgi:hypothetical protein
MAWSLVGAVAVMGAGVLLNRLLDLQVMFFFPGSMIVNRLAPFSTDSALVRLSIVALNLAIWTAIIYALLTIGAWRPRRPRVPQPRA